MLYIFISHNKKAKNKKETYIHMFVTKFPQKAKKKRVRWTVDGDKIS